MNKFCTFAVAAIVATFLVSVPQPVEAASAAQYRAYGNQLYKQKQYSKALQYYEASYKLQPDPQLKTFIDKLRAHLGVAAPGAAAAANEASGTGSAAVASSAIAAVKAWRFGGELFGTMAFMGLGDLKDDLAYAELGMVLGPGETWEGEVKGSGFGFGLLVTVFSPMGLGLGLGYGSESVSGLTMKYADNSGAPASTFSSEQTIAYSQSKIPISVLYRKQLSSKFHFGGRAGVDILSGTLKFDSKSVFGGSSGSSEYTNTGEFPGSGLGFHLGMDAGFDFTSNFGAFLGLGYAIGATKGFEGTFTNSGSGGSSTSLPVKVVMHEHTDGRHISTVLVQDPLAADETEFQIDVSGLRLNFGITILIP